MARSKEDRRYWVVSPNVGNDETTVSEWRQASVTRHAAFMGYDSRDKGHGASGHKFAHSVKPGDIILIARRHRSEPEIVGFGVVRGNFQRSLKGVHLSYKPINTPPLTLSRAKPCTERHASAVGSDVDKGAGRATSDDQVLIDSLRPPLNLDQNETHPFHRTLTRSGDAPTGEPMPRPCTA